MSRLRSISVVGLLAALGLSGACGDPSASKSAITDEMVARHNTSIDRQQKYEADRRERINKQIQPLKAALASFKAEKKSPPDCRSSNLDNARAQAVAIVATADPKAWELDGVHTMVTAVLDLADEAKAARCAQLARKLYDEVIRSFTGSAYAGLRQRAEIGIGDLRASR